MPSTTLYEFGDIIVVEFAYTNQLRAGKRPVVVINSREYSASHPDIIAMPVTSREHQQLTNSAVEIYNWQDARLTQRSFIKLTINTYHPDIVVTALGKIDKRTRIALRKALAGALGFNLVSSPT